MVKTTIYLPDELKRAIEAEARRRDISEAEVIRDALGRELPTERPKPRGALFSSGEPIADRVDKLLAGFGAD